MRRQTIRPHKKPRLYEIGISLLLISNVCFYTLETMTLYLILSTIGITIVFLKALFSFHGRLKIDKCFVWLTVIYIMFTVNGCLRLRFGTYNWDMMLFTYASNVALLIAFKRIFETDNWLLNMKKVIIFPTLFIIGYILFKESANIGQIGLRIGDSLGGNVNSVGVSLGILSIFIACLY